MKRMNVREFRATLPEHKTEPIEVVRYAETIGYWVPIALTTEPPKTKPAFRASGRKPTTVVLTTSAEEAERRLKAISEELDKFDKLSKTWLVGKK